MRVITSTHYKSQPAQPVSAKISPTSTLTGLLTGRLTWTDEMEPDTVAIYLAAALYRGRQERRFLLGR